MFFTECVVPVDLAFLIDASGSLKDSFQDIQKFVKKVINAYKIGPDATHVAAISYSDDARVAFDFNTLKGKDLTKENLNKLVDKINATGGKTRIDLALRKAATDIYSEKGGQRPGRPKVRSILVS